MISWNALTTQIYLVWFSLNKRYWNFISEHIDIEITSNDGEQLKLTFGLPKYLMDMSDPGILRE